MLCVACVFVFCVVGVAFVGVCCLLVVAGRLFVVCGLLRVVRRVRLAAWCLMIAVCCVV